MSKNKINFKNIALIFFSLFFFSSLNSEVEAARKGKKNKGYSNASMHSIKRDTRAATGYCLRRVQSEAEARDILRRNLVVIARDSNRRQLRSLSLAVKQIEVLTGGKSPYLEGVTVTFPKKRRYSRYLRKIKTIEMGANFKDDNVAHITHEIGHHAGRAGLYEPYFSRVPVCRVTRYGMTNRAEEFAEVFAAFVTNPELLRNSKHSSCRRAYDFLVEVFPKAHMFAFCSAKNEQYEGDQK